MRFRDKEHFEEELSKNLEFIGEALNKNDEPHKDLHKHIFSIEHRNEGEVNSDWAIHTNGGKTHKAYSVDGESPTWSHNDKRVEDSHPEVAKILDKTIDHPHGSQDENSIGTTMHDETGKKVSDKSHEAF